MHLRRLTALAFASCGLLFLASPPEGLGQQGKKDFPDFPGGGKGDFGGKGGFGGKVAFGPPGGETRKILKDFDKNGDGWLNAVEREAARAEAKKSGGGMRMPKGFNKGEAGKPGPKVDPADAKAYPDAKLYDTSVLRTLFLEFESKDWEAELQDFHGTDVDVPATLTVDGKKYPNVGVHFRGMSSYGMVPAGSKRSFNLAMDLADEKQRLLGHKTLNLLNSHEDPTFMSTVLYSHIAGKYLPTPKSNFVKVVVNGESWGVYASVQQFNKDFTKENFNSSKGARWKVRGSPGGGGGLEYLGENIEDYKRRYEIKSKDDEKDWKALINFCKVLNQTPPDQLEAALRPIADVDGILWFLALDVALINGDGYWVRASDYSIYLDEKKIFHMVPHDMNEAFKPAMGPVMVMVGPGMGGMGGPGMGAGMFRFPAPGELLPSFLRDELKLSAEQQKALEALQKDTDARLEKLLTEEQRKQWKQMREGPGGGFGPPGFGPPGFGPPGFGPPGGPGGDFGGPGGPGGPGGGFGGPGGGRGPGRGPGGPGGGQGGGVTLDPLVNVTDARKPLRSKLLVVPALRAKYLANIRQIATESLDWKTLGPVVAGYRSLIHAEVKADTRKLESFEAFERTTADKPTGTATSSHEFPLRKFADDRRKFLLDYKEGPAGPAPKGKN